MGRYEFKEDYIYDIRIAAAKTELTAHKLLNLGGADYEQDKHISLEEAMATGNVARDFGIEEWDWPQGVGLYGLYMLQEHTGRSFLDFFESWFQNNIKRGLPSRNINTTAPYLTLLQIMDRLPEKELYEAMCIKQAEWLMNELPKTKDNGFQHVTSGIGDRNGVILNEGQLWADTLFMAVLFLQQMGNRYNRKEWKDEALHQVLIHIKYLYDKTAASSTMATAFYEMTISAVFSGAGAIHGSPWGSPCIWNRPKIWNRAHASFFWIPLRPMQKL